MSINFYALIIGTEILNARREDKHFKFVRDELQKYDEELFASFIVKDDKELMKKSFSLIKSDENSVLFSFGGIGSTPDDLTREIASEIFTQKPLVRHKKFEQDIIDRFKKKAYPNRIHMSDLPQDAKLLFNEVNNMSGFCLEDRFFFTPGFPEMAHPMIKDVIKSLCSQSKKKFRFTLLANTSEDTLIEQMKLLPPSVELSSLPIFINKKPQVELSLSGYEEKEVREYFELFKNELQKLKVGYKLL
ncbi:competence/damage-inducible protein A [Sulfurimonas sp.]|uniref:competence/damage-inducible protein A n=1 Tax=Sulfurimonas sp. TaxID=2022749 RepID=UPI002AB1748C|nr:molybdopterin-binding protein [Sulfurimonas sp.]